MRGQTRWDDRIRRGLGECLDLCCAAKGGLLVAGDCDAELIWIVRMACRTAAAAALRD